ncbi:MAG: iron chelate uptake ABC transporter family permease subunit [Gammaproteobacteria bacterium]|nr:iron chelate uptake ABC transporter family permease subunit [Gammaproteobacteria bacterium]
MDDFIYRAILAGLLVAVVAGPMGCFVVWRRMAYFGEAISHSALLGIVLGFLMGLSPTFGVLLITVGLGLFLALLQRWQPLANDTLLGIFSHTSLSLGLVGLGFLENQQLDLYAFLFGDILSVTNEELWIMAGVSLLSLLVLAYLWQQLLAVTLHEELAQVEGVSLFRSHVVFVMLIAVLVAVALKVVGILLITSLLIIPSAAAQRLANSPEQMAFGSIVIGALSVLIGIQASLWWDSPTGPSIVVTASLFFLLSNLLPRRH